MCEKWIDSEKKLPEEYKVVLIYTKFTREYSIGTIFLSENMPAKWLIKNILFPVSIKDTQWMEIPEGKK